MNRSIIRAVVTSLFVLAVPVLLISASVAWAVNDLGLYARGFDKYDIPSVTGIEREDLVQVGREIRSYFHSTQEPLDVRTTIYGREQVLFNYREVIHMADVKDLIWVVYGAGALALLFMAGVGAAGFCAEGKKFCDHVMSQDSVGGGGYGGAGGVGGADIPGGLRPAISALSPGELCQRFLAVGPAQGLSGDDVPGGVLAGRDVLCGVPDAGRSGAIGVGFGGLPGV